MNKYLPLLSLAISASATKNSYSFDTICPTRIYGCNLCRYGVQYSTIPGATIGFKEAYEAIKKHQEICHSKKKKNPVVSQES